MPYVHRNSQNEIMAVTRWPSGSTEFLPDTNSEVTAFLDPPPPLPEDTDLTPGDIERLFLSLGITLAQIIAIKRSRP